jgi:hypothetical protein
MLQRDTELLLWHLLGRQGMLAEEATRKALELDDSCRRHAARADALTFSYKWGEAEKSSNELSN